MAFMDASDRPDIGIASRHRRDRLRTVVVVAPQGLFPALLRQAIEDNFVWVVVEEVGHIDEVIRIFPNTVSLLLIHPTLVADAERRADDLFRFHPLAMSAVLSCGGRMDGASILASKLIRGVMPINTKLDSALSILSLLLLGTEYFSREFFSEREKPLEQPALPEAGEQPGLPEHLKVLTKREVQVLHLVERGLQNKSIARDLNLSGHTVKIHLHNIITKLQARNRTEAAALYRSTHVSRSLN